MLQSYFLKFVAKERVGKFLKITYKHRHGWSRQELPRKWSLDGCTKAHTNYVTPRFYLLISETYKITLGPLKQRVTVGETQSSWIVSINSITEKFQFISSPRPKCSIYKYISIKSHTFRRHTVSHMATTRTIEAEWAGSRQAMTSTCPRLLVVFWLSAVGPVTWLLNQVCFIMPLMDCKKAKFCLFYFVFHSVTYLEGGKEKLPPTSKLKQ